MLGVVILEGVVSVTSTVVLPSILVETSAMVVVVWLYYYGYSAVVIWLWLYGCGYRAVIIGLWL